MNHCEVASFKQEYLVLVCHQCLFSAFISDDLGNVIPCNNWIKATS